MPADPQQKTTGSPFWIKLSSFSDIVHRILKKLYKLFLENIALKLFLSPEKAINYAYDDMPKTSAMIIGNYCMGWILLGENSEKLVWQTFSERGIITTETAHISKTVRGYMKKNEYEIRINADFPQVIRACRRQKWTWINEPAIQIYTELNEMGFIKTYETYKDGELVGGLWGLVVGNTFAIMSMFHHVDRAGAIALGTLVVDLSEGKYSIIDCGALKPHFERFGAQGVLKEMFIKQVVLGLIHPKMSERKSEDDL